MKKHESRHVLGRRASTLFDLKLDFGFWICFSLAFWDVKKTLFEKPVFEKPVSEKPVSEKPVSEKPVSEKQIVQFFGDSNFLMNFNVMIP